MIIMNVSVYDNVENIYDNVKNIYDIVENIHDIVEYKLDWHELYKTIPSAVPYLFVSLSCI